MDPTHALGQGRGSAVMWQSPSRPPAMGIIVPILLIRKLRHNLVVKCMGVGLPWTRVQIMTLPLN